MMATFLRDPDETNGEHGIPHLSHSRVNRYLLCPEQYRLYYVEKLRPKVQSANLVFGNIMHQALAQFFRGNTDPVKCFLDMWNVLERVPLDYSERDSWEKLKSVGENLLKKLLVEEVPRLQKVTAVEKPFEITITGLPSPFVGVVDLIAEFNGQPTVIDWKTSSTSYGADDAILADQLTAYRLAEPAIEQLGFCVLVKTKEPKIQWQLTRRTGNALREYIVKISHVATDITAGRFFRRSGPWCSWCDYRPLCVGKIAEAAATLVKSQ